MNVFRSVGQSLINFARASAQALQPIAPRPIPEKPVEAMPGLFQDTFEPAPSKAAAEAEAPAEVRSAHSYFSAAPAAALQADAFEPAARAPVNLSGGVTPTFAPPEELAAPAPPPASAFTASLDDLEGLLG